MTLSLHGTSISKLVHHVWVNANQQGYVHQGYRSDLEFHPWKVTSHDQRSTGRLLILKRTHSYRGNIPLGEPKSRKPAGKRSWISLLVDNTPHGRSQQPRDFMEPRETFLNSAKQRTNRWLSQLSICCRRQRVAVSNKLGSQNDNR